MFWHQPRLNLRIPRAKVCKVKKANMHTCTRYIGAINSKPKKIHGFEFFNFESEFLDTWITLHVLLSVLKINCSKWFSWNPQLMYECLGMLAINLWNESSLEYYPPKHLPRPVNAVILHISLYFYLNMLYFTICCLVRIFPTTHYNSTNISSRLDRAAIHACTPIVISLQQC